MAAGGRRADGGAWRAASTAWIRGPVAAACRIDDPSGTNGKRWRFVFMLHAKRWFQEEYQ
jgi:hypothetical protein